MDVDPTLTYARVRARPVAALDRSRHVLVVFGVSPVTEDNTAAADAPAPVDADPQT